MTAELTRLRCLSALSPGAATAAAPAADVFRQLLAARAWHDAAELARAAAPTVAAFLFALERLAAECAATCAIALDESLDEVAGPDGAPRGGAIASWGGLRDALELWESETWLAGARAACAPLSPPGRLRRAAAEVRACCSSSRASCCRASWLVGPAEAPRGNEHSRCARSGAVGRCLAPNVSRVLHHAPSRMPYAAASDFHPVTFRVRCKRTG